MYNIYIYIGWGRRDAWQASREKEGQKEQQGGGKGEQGYNIHTYIHGLIREYIHREYILAYFILHAPSFFLTQ